MAPGRVQRLKGGRGHLVTGTPNGSAALGPLSIIRLEETAATPLHAQLAAAVRERIRDGELAVGTPLPGEKDIAAALGISRHTVRHALGVLVNEGWLHRQRGARTVVASHQPDDTLIERDLGSFYAFAWEVEARGAQHRSRVLARELLPADARLAQLLLVNLGTPLERIERLRLANQEPLTLEVSILRAALSRSFQDADLEQHAIYDLLEQRHKIVVVRAHESLRPVVLDDRAAGLLGVGPGAPAFSVERISWSADGPVEWQQSLIRGDRYLYSVDLSRSRRAR